MGVFRTGLVGCIGCRRFVGAVDADSGVRSNEEMSGKAKYEERYCAFVDILGFSELVAGLRDTIDQFETVRQLLKKIHTPDTTHVGLPETEFRAQSISDAVAISTRCDTIALSVLCAALRGLSLDLLHAGYFTRGVVCKGLLYHDDSMVFGEALIKAYRLESTIVKYPRIMLTKNVVDDMKATPDFKTLFYEHIRQAQDGPYFLHILWHLRMLLDVVRERGADSAEPDPDLSYYETIRNQIQRRFSNSVDNPNHFEKAQWFARYWNDSIIRIRTSVDRISGPGLDEKPAVWGP